MREAVGGLKAYAGMPSMVILGDMAELGPASRQEHEELVEWLKTLNFKRVILVGPQFARVCEPSGEILVFREVASLQSHLENHPPRGFTILVKGSRVMELERLMPHLMGK